jgi:hypothetical protein
MRQFCAVLRLPTSRSAACFAAYCRARLPAAHHLCVPEIGIGSASRPPLPHHRTYGFRIRQFGGLSGHLVPLGGVRQGVETCTSEDPSVSAKPCRRASPFSVGMQDGPYACLAGLGPSPCPAWLRLEQALFGDCAHGGRSAVHVIYDRWGGRGVRCGWRRRVQCSPAPQHRQRWRGSSKTCHWAIAGSGRRGSREDRSRIVLSEHIKEDGTLLFVHARRVCLEGIVSKRLTHPIDRGL